MVAEPKLAETDMAFSFSILPRENVEGGVSGKLGNFNADFIADFYPATVGKKANVIISELVSNVLEHGGSARQKLTVDVKLAMGRMVIKVQNAAQQWQYDKVKAHLKMIKNYTDVSKLLTDAIVYRRSQGLKGGLGLIRLASECRAELSVSYNQTTAFMTVTAKYDLRGE